MDHRRFVTFLVFFFAFTFLYNEFIVPKFFPQPPQPVVEESVEVSTSAAAEAEADAAVENTTAPPESTEPAIFPERTVTLGSLDPASGYILQVEVTSVGAAIAEVKLTDPKFRDLTNRDEQLTVVGNNSTADRTFSTAVSSIDEQLAAFDQTLESINWEVVSSDASHAAFAFDAPDGSLRVTKSYTLNRVEEPADKMPYEFRNNASGHTIQLELNVTNLTDQPAAFSYELQGPVGVVLENREHTRKYRDIKIEFQGEDDDVTLGTKELSKLYDSHLTEARAAGQPTSSGDIRSLVRQKDPWTGDVRYAGVDVQFFAALVAPLDDRQEAEKQDHKWIDRTYPVMIEEDTDNVSESDISFRFASATQQLGPKGTDDSLTHSYAFFVGPKRSALLDPAPMEAERVLDYGTGLFSFFGLTGLVARMMHFLLTTFYSIGIPYGLAIILLTVFVRGCMFPISRKQAINAARMKDLQPKLNELKQKYGEDKQKLAQAQMELWRKHNINPLSGCMPLLFQMPIFIGLYSCLNTAVDLRLSSFLWIDNLAAPDALFTFPFATPAIIGPHISVLPIVTVVLFLIQQKLFMPPPADEQAEMTQKMMNMMTFMFGALFWHQPAGLCVYFICSSLWGIAERKLLGNTKTAVTDEPTVTVKEPAEKNGSKQKSANSTPKEPGKQGFLARLVEAAEQAQKQAEKNKQKQAKGKNKKR